MADWSELQVALLWMIAVRLYSAVEVKCFRSICRSWRSSVSGEYRPLSNLPVIKLNPLVVVAAFTSQGEVEEIQGLDLGAFISRASFYRVTDHCSLTHGWLLKSDVDINLGTFQFINPLSRQPYHHRCQSLNLLKFTFTEIREAYVVQPSPSAFKRVILVTLEGGDHFVGIGFDGKIRYWNGVIWTRIRIENDQMAQFCDIIVFRGSFYALDSKGIVWWITTFSAIFRLDASLENNINTTTDMMMSFVECCGELYIVQRLHEENLLQSKAVSMDHNACVGAINPPFYNVVHDDAGDEKCELPLIHCPKTIGFKVFHLNQNLVKCVEVTSLGNNAIMMATDTCFSVDAGEFYGCLPNVIYFNDEKEEEIKVFKLEDGSVVTTVPELFPIVCPTNL